MKQHAMQINFGETCKKCKRAGKRSNKTTLGKKIKSMKVQDFFSPLYPVETLCSAKKKIKKKIRSNPNRLHK